MARIWKVRTGVVDCCSQRAACVSVVTQAKEKYEKALDELSRCTPQYIEGMEQQFEQCQNFEERRLLFAREVLLDIKRHLNLTENQRFETSEWADTMRQWSPVSLANALKSMLSSQLFRGVPRAGANHHIGKCTGGSELVQQQSRPGHAHELATV